VAGIGLGLTASLLLDVAAGGAIVLVLTLLVLVAALIGPHDSLLARRRLGAAEAKAVS
jgi:ABC-type Mn2+/Zn2+ transport system permease subunit